CFLASFCSRSFLAMSPLHVEMWSVLISTPNLAFTSAWIAVGVAVLPSFFRERRTASILLILASPFFSCGAGCVSATSYLWCWGRDGRRLHLAYPGRHGRPSAAVP